jgi:hypothetical protein
MYLNPKKYNLNSRVLIKQSTPNHIIIVIDRKSRIIMKDGMRINEQKQSINQMKPNTKVSLQTTAPICSKTKEYLLSKNINITNS